MFYKSYIMYTTHTHTHKDKGKKIERERVRKGGNGKKGNMSYFGLVLSWIKPT